MLRPDYKQLLENIKAELDPAQIAQAEATAERLYEELPHKDELEKNRVVVLLGGGKDSTWMTSYTRLVQLLIWDKPGHHTFTLRALTGRHPGMQHEVMKNIDRTYKALGMYDDPLAETIVVHNDRSEKFDPNMAMPDDVLRLNRTDVLMNGHRYAAEGRGTFCNACNNNLMKWIAAGAADDGGADILITGDSLNEQGAYSNWIGRSAHDFGVNVKPLKPLPQFQRTLSKGNLIAQEHAAIIHGHDSQAIKERSIDTDFPKKTKLFSVFSEGEATYSARDHMPFLTDFLHFDFNSLMFSFTETDCGNPALMAHLYGLAAEKLFGASYADGVREYRDYAIELMKTKEFPDELVEAMSDRYKDDAAITEMRKKVEQYAWDAYRLDATQLTAMVYAPFASQGANLHRFIQDEHADLLGEEDHIHALLRGEHHPGDKELSERLEAICGLTLKQLQQTYVSALVRNPLDKNHETDDLGGKLILLRNYDPHQAMIYSRLNSEGVEQRQLITGR